MNGSLYIHIPFCLSKCRYCDFNSIPLNHKLSERYVGALINEMVQRSKDEPPINTVYIGGGTPTILDADQLREVMHHLRQNFDITSDAEITIEANPGTIDSGKLDAIISSGINRLSMGVQSFNDEELAFMGRLHKSADVEKAVNAARNAGFKNLSLDLIYGLPKQNVQQWQENLKKAFALMPEHISVYELTIEDGTPFADDLIMGRFNMPDEDLISDMYYLAIDKMAEAGFHQYEISNFARPGYECRHNLNYWNSGAYLGLGAGAHSFWNNIRSSNTKEITGYCNCIEKLSDTTAEQDFINEAEAVKETIFLGLRKVEGIDLSVLPDDARNKIEKAASDLVRSSFVCLEGGCLKLSRKGLILSSEIIVRLLSGIESPSPA
ncbi:MAG: radical SAM family heme chaperone HemW [Nitrospiraceae bacterium]|nr:radical SAM family heme chaperone HemW [Nitrospiraceae bacterium]